MADHFSCRCLQTRQSNQSCQETREGKEEERHHPREIHWGEAVPPAPGEPTCQFRMEHFPNYLTVIEGGCRKIPGKKSEMIFICPGCEEETILWKK